jgi:aryl-alcohol dehydrogenase-like predicted oxidoreductase
MKYQLLGEIEQLSAIDLGCISMRHGCDVPDDYESVAILHYAPDCAYSPLADSFLINSLNINDYPENESRRTLPGYPQQYQENNENVVARFAELAIQKGDAAAQLALACLLEQSDNIIPIPGTKKRNKLKDNAGSVCVTLTEHAAPDIEAFFSKTSKCRRQV